VIPFAEHVQCILAVHSTFTTKIHTYIHTLKYVLQTYSHTSKYVRTQWQVLCLVPVQHHVQCILAVYSGLHERHRERERERERRRRRRRRRRFVVCCVGCFGGSRVGAGVESE
jgi:hypothetical protein